MEPDSWRPGVAERLGFYVYLLIDPRDGKPFYVGKGQDSRCFNHVEEARKTTADSTGDYPKLRLIRQIESKHHQVRIELLRHGLHEVEKAEEVAYAIEAAAIDLLLLLKLEPAIRVAGHAHGMGRMSVEEVNAAYGAAVVDFGEDRVVLIRPNRLYERDMGGEPLYEATRQWWRVGSDKRSGPCAPQWAMAVYRGVVRAVYRIDGWERASEKDLTANPSIKGKWRFFGEIDSVMTERFKYADVTDELPQSAQNPIRYLNCGRQPKT
jgi:hypothetical protein